jgi:hypothetical protein
MTALVFGGVEVPSNRTLLERAGVDSVMLNFWGLRKRGLPKTKPYLVGEHFLPEMKVWIDSGSVQADKAELTVRERDEYAGEYEDFIAYNYDRIEGWVEFDSQKLGLPAIAANRAAFENDPKMWVVWHESYGIPVLRRWAESYANIAIPGATVESATNLAGITRQLQTQYPVAFHALAVAKPDNLRQIPFSTASTLSWLSPMRRGETIVWDGSKLVRYPKRMKAQARPRYKSLVTGAGLDFEKFLDDDTLEATKVAVWSYRQLEIAMDKEERKKRLTSIPGGRTPGEGKKVADNSDDTLYTGLMEMGMGASTNSDVGVRNVSATPPAPRDPQEMTILPGVGIEIQKVIDVAEDGTQTLKDLPMMRSQATSMRQCDTCFVAANCPAFKPGSVCAFNLPVQVQTADQLKALLLSVVEMQGQRVAFMKFAEDVGGGYSDPNLSQEVDRLFKLVSTMKKMDENREFERITIERQSSGGVLSRIFGNQAQAVRDEPAKLSEEQTTLIIQQALEDI